MNASARKAAAVEFLTLAAAGRVDDAYARHVGPAFRHHNPYFRGDAASLREAMRANAASNPNKLFEVQRAVAEGDLVAVHSRVRQHPGDRGAVVVHIFRFDGDRIVELWDVGQATPDESPNENGIL